MRDPAFRADHLRPSTSPELGLNAHSASVQTHAPGVAARSFPNSGLRIYLRSEPQAGRRFQFFTLCGSNFGRLDLPGSFDQGDLPAALGILPLFCSCDLSLLRCVLAGGGDLDGLAWARAWAARACSSGGGGCDTVWTSGISPNRCDHTVFVWWCRGRTLDAAPRTSHQRAACKACAQRDHHGCNAGKVRTQGIELEHEESFGTDCCPESYAGTAGSGRATSGPPRLSLGLAALRLANARAYQRLPQPQPPKPPRPRRRLRTNSRMIAPIVALAIAATMPAPSRMPS